MKGKKAFKTANTMKTLHGASYDHKEDFKPKIYDKREVLNDTNTGKRYITVNI